LQYIH